MRHFYGNVPMDDLTEFEQGMLNLYTLPAHDCRRYVHEALEMLTEGQKRTIRLVHFEGLTLKEVAERSNESFSNVRHHYYRGLVKLRDHLLFCILELWRERLHFPGSRFNKKNAVTYLLISKLNSG